MTLRPRPNFPPIDPRDYLDLAKGLASQSDVASVRTAADRAYYAAFLFSRDQLASKGYITPYYSTQDHQHISRSLIAIVGAFGDEERRLRRIRNLVTYNTGNISVQRSLQWMISTAERIIELVDRVQPHS